MTIWSGLRAVLHARVRWDGGNYALLNSKNGDVRPSRCRHSLARIAVLDDEDYSEKERSLSVWVRALSGFQVCSHGSLHCPLGRQTPGVIVACGTRIDAVSGNCSILFYFSILPLTQP